MALKRVVKIDIKNQLLELGEMNDPMHALINVLN